MSTKSAEFARQIWLKYKSKLTGAPKNNLTKKMSEVADVIPTIREAVESLQIHLKKLMDALDVFVIPPADHEVQVYLWDLPKKSPKKAVKRKRVLAPKNTLS